MYLSLGCRKTLCRCCNELIVESGNTFSFVLPILCFASVSFHSSIAPDESYLIFDGKRDGGYGDSDLNISYRIKDGVWGEPINLGDQINTPAWEATGNVTSDGKYLFFNRMIGPRADQNVDIFWVEATFIEALRPD